MENELNDKERQAILDKSPLLKALLDPMTRIDPLNFNVLIGESQKEIHKLEDFFGDNFFHLGIYPIWTQAGFKKIFHPGMTPEDQVGLIEMIAALGHQIGNMQEAAKVCDDVTITLVELGSLKTPKNLDEIKTARSTIWLAMSTGVYWSRVTGGKDKSLNPFQKFLDERPDIFK